MMDMNILHSGEFLHIKLHVNIAIRSDDTDLINMLYNTCPE